MSTTTLYPVAIKLDAAIKERVKRLAEARQRSAHWLMREAVSQYVDREEKRESFRQDALHAWEAYHSTGLYVSADAADAWLEQLEQGQDAPLPKPQA